MKVEAASSTANQANGITNVGSVSNVALTSKTLDFSTTENSRTSTRLSGTTADNYNVQYIKRTSIQNGAGGTLTATGSVLKLENVATQTAGTLTDSVPLLSLAQSNNST